MKARKTKANKEFHNWVKKKYPNNTGFNGDGIATIIKDYKKHKRRNK